MTTFFSNTTAAGTSTAYPVNINGGELMAFNVEGLGDATIQLQRLAPSGNYIPVLYNGAADIDTDGHYIVDGLSGTYRVVQAGTSDGLYASLETENAARVAL